MCGRVFLFVSALRVDGKAAVTISAAALSINYLFSYPLCGLQLEYKEEFYQHMNFLDKKTFGSCSEFLNGKFAMGKQSGG